MNLRAVVDGSEHALEIPSNGNSPDRKLRIDGAEIGADVQRIEPGVYSILIDSRSFEVRIENGDGLVYASVNGRRVPVEIRDPRARARGGGAISLAGPQSISSPMPGKVVRLLVAEGEEVEAGQGLLVVEAMKMQNEIKSPKAGRVAAIRVREGAPAGAGATLVVVE